MSAADQKGMKTTFKRGKCIIHKDDVTVATGFLDGPLYVIRTKNVPMKSETAFLSSLQLWHERMAHVDKRGIAEIADRGVAKGLKI